VFWYNGHHQHYLDGLVKLAKGKVSQESMQQHCLYNAKKLNYDWIITTDVDEFIYVHKNISSILATTTNDDDNNNNNNNLLGAEEPPLKTFMKQYDWNEIGSLLMKPIYMGRNTDIDVDPTLTNSSTPLLLVDYVWRFNQSYDELPWQRYKQIYNPKKCWYIGIHYAWVCKGEKEVRIEPNVDTGLIMYHYKTPHKGIFRATSAMVKMQDTTIRDMYRNDLVQNLDTVDWLFR
jgi:hypothetical protein